MQLTLTLTRYAEPDALVSKVLARLAAQEGAGGEILFIDQGEETALRAADFTNQRWRCRIIRRRMAVLSAARNLSLAEAAHDLVLFCDADALAAPDWAARLGAALCAPEVAVAGSRILPEWSDKPPLLTASRVVRDQFSLFDLGGATISSPRVVGAGFGVDRTKASEEMYFDEQLGRRDGRLFGGEESDLCRRVLAAGKKVVYVGGAAIHHVIPAERLRTGWILKRLYYAGYGRSQIGGAPSPSRKPGLADWLLLPITLPPYALGWLSGKWARRTQ